MPGDVFPHGAVLHRQRLLIVDGQTSVKSDSEHFRGLPSLAKNPIDLALLESRLAPFRDIRSDELIGCLNSRARSNQLEAGPVWNATDLWL
jgi:hypothetical protein